MMMRRTSVLFVLLCEPVPSDVHLATLGLAVEVNPCPILRLSSRLHLPSLGSYPGRMTIW